MKRFIGVAALALAAQSGLATAQTVVVPSDEMPRSRAERGPSDTGPGRAGAPQRGEQEPRSDGPRAQPRGAQNAPSGDRARESPREPMQQQQQRVQGQDPRGERQGLQPAERPQREQAQRERPDDPGARRSPDEQRPGTRPASPQTAQPPRSQNDPNAAETPRPRTDAPSQQGQAPAARETPAQAPGQAPAPGQAGTAAQRPAPPAPAGAAPAMPSPGTAGAPPATGGTSPAAAQPAEQQPNDGARQRIADTVRERVQRNEIRPVQNLGVSVSVGAELPSRVRLEPLPRDIASIRPEYRDYRYTVSDREIVIVDPRSRRIVDVIERDGRGPSQITYSVFEQRRDLRRWSRPDTVMFQEGVVLPADAPYYDLPPEIVQRNPNWRGYRYVMTERDEVAIVEPRSRRVVQVVDKGGSATTASTQPQPAAAGDRHQLVRIIMNDARPGDITGAEASSLLPDGRRWRGAPDEGVPFQ
jgi:hypothetical protein